MIEKFEHHGKWWLPNKPQGEIAGTLKFDPAKGSTLELIGSFNPNISNLTDYLSPAVILGISTKGKQITLQNCFETSRNLNIPGMITSVFEPEFVFIGSNFTKPEDVLFKRALVKFSYFDEWVGTSGFTLEDKDENFIVKHNLPGNIAAGSFQNWNLTIKFRRTATLGISHKLNVEQYAYLEITSTIDKPFIEYLNLIKKVRYFLSLGVEEPVYLVSFDGRTEAARTITREKDAYYNPIQAYFAQPGSPFELKTLYKHNMLFSLRDLKGRFEHCMKKWLEKAELLETVYDLYAGMYFNPRMYQNHKFLTAVQAIEVYHRRTMSNGKLTLIDRIQEVVEKYSNVLINMFNEEAVIKIVETRNYFTHYDVTLKNKAATGEELYVLTTKLRVLIIVCLLKEIDLDIDDIKAITPRSKLYRWLNQMT